MTDIKKIRINWPLFCLVFVNFVPFFGVLFLGWKASMILLLYWMENIVVGFYNVFKMKLAKVPSPVVKGKTIFPTMTFLINYSIFTAVHGASILAFLLIDNQVDPETNGGMDIIFPSLDIFFWVTVGLLFVSHGVSFVSNFLIKGECHNVQAVRLINQPIRRLIIMHMTIIIGAYLGTFAGEPLGALLALVTIKTGVDVAAHLKERKGIKKPEPRYGSPYKLDGAGKVAWLKEQGALSDEEAVGLKGKIPSKDKEGAEGDGQ